MPLLRETARAHSEVPADLFIDATGRARVLEKLAEKHLSRAAVKHRSARPRLVGFKNHFRGVSLEKGACEIYFFRGGYGGLSYVEQGAANFCFLIKAGEVKRFNGKPNKMIEELVFKNKRARFCLKDAEPIGDWLAVSIDGFGKKELRPAANLFTVGDSAAFIDPFTGSGMLMALEGSRLLAGCIAACASPDEIAAELRAGLPAKLPETALGLRAPAQRGFYAESGGGCYYGFEFEQKAHRVFGAGDAARSSGRHR